MVASRSWTILFLALLRLGLAPATGAERTVELVTAESEHQARVVARAMRTGFFIEQLLIPETEYVGRFDWSRLQPAMQAALEEIPAGDPFLFSDPSGRYLVARVMPTGPPALLGQAEYASDRETLWSVLSVGPTDVRLSSQEVDVDTDDLEAICRNKRRFIDGRLRAAQANVEALNPTAPPEAALEAHATLTSVLSWKGEMEAAIDSVESLMQRLPPPATGQARTYQDIAHRVLGILELRRGEVENCLHDHHREMCLFPLSEAAQHRLGDGARRAVEHFSRYLERHPDDLEVRWLLNVAAMTVGTYPEGVPAYLRIGPEAFESRLDPGRFWDVAATAGLAYSDNAGGSVADDFDADGLIDLVVSSRDPCEPLRFYRNRGDGTFDDLTAISGLETQLGGLNVTQADFDNDGRLDLFVMRGGWETAIRNSLLRNRPGPDGLPIFEDVTEPSGLGGPAHRTHTAAWADYDGDGWLDLFLGTSFPSAACFAIGGTARSRKQPRRPDCASAR